MPDEIDVEVVLLWQRKLEHDELVRGQGVQLSQNRRLEQIFRPRLLRTVDVHLRLEDRHETGGHDWPGDAELLGDDLADAGGVGMLDEGAHFRSEDAPGPGL